MKKQAQRDQSKVVYIPWNQKKERKKKGVLRFYAKKDKKKGKQEKRNLFKVIL